MGFGGIFRMLQRSLPSSCQAGLQCMCWMHSLWYGFLLLGLGLEDGPAWPILSSKLTLLAFLPSATSASRPRRDRLSQHRHRGLLPIITEQSMAAASIVCLNILYHTNGGLDSSNTFFPSFHVCWVLLFFLGFYHSL